jgi:hypothetical protein
MIPTYVSFDPGEKSNIGYVVWSEEAKPMKTDQTTLEGLDLLFSELPDTVTTFIVEGYTVFGHVNHTGSKVVTAQVIGYIKGEARSRKIECVEQPSSILKTAQMWSGVKLDGKHSVSHWKSAYNHGYYYLHRKGLIRPRVLDM